MQRLLRVGADHGPGVDGLVIEQGHAVKLGGEDLKVVPVGKLSSRHAHRIHRPMVAGLRQAIAGECLDLAVEGLFMLAMRRVLVEAQIGVAVIGLGIGARPVGDLVGIDEHVLALGPGLEFVQRLFVIVLRHAGIDAVVPIVHPADQIVILVHMAVGHQRAAVQAAAIEHRHLIVETHHHKVDALDQRIGRCPVGKRRPFRD